MTIKARVIYDPQRLTSRLVISNDKGRVITWEDGAPWWTESQGEATHLDLGTDESIARAMYEALAEHFGGTAVNALQLRKDYEAERARVDRMIGGLLDTPTTVVIDGKAVMVGGADGRTRSDA